MSEKLTKSHKLGIRKRQLLKVLYEHRDFAYTERDMIEYVYGDMNGSNRASASRALKTLVEDDLVETRKDISTRLFRISLRGVQYVEHKLYGSKR